GFIRANEYVRGSEVKMTQRPLDKLYNVVLNNGIAVSIKNDVALKLVAQRPLDRYSTNSVFLFW
ncbi:367_t:CDS:2, partial [Gigaspora margarita]